VSVVVYISHGAHVLLVVVTEVARCCVVV
jgi:hypothetical protein